MSSTTEPTHGPTVSRALPSLLVEPVWLEARLGGPGLRTVDLRDEDAYVSGHIPGAVRLDLAELGSSVAGCDNVLIPPAEFDVLMGERGISNEDVVVAYDDQWGLAAARLVWALHRYGHSEIAVLNGGWDRWREEGRAAASGPEHHAPGRFVSEPRADVFADTEWIAQRIDAGDALLVDARTSSEFEQGHLPGAVSWDWFNSVPPGSWDVSRPAGELLAEWKALGLDPTREVTVYCRSGMRAAHAYVALRNAGFPRVRLYDGSWQEWSTTMEDSDGH